MPSGKVGDPGVRGDSGECSTEVCERLRVVFLETDGKVGDADAFALRGGNTQSYTSRQRRPLDLSGFE